MIFLSHSWTNKPEARKLVEVFARERLPSWLDEQQLDDGAVLLTSLQTAIAQSDIFLYLVSNAANESEWVQKELKLALCLEHKKKLRVVPVRLANSEEPLPDSLRGRITSTLDPGSGGATRLAQLLSQVEGCDHVADICQLSATVRIDGHRLIHTLAESRELIGSRSINVKVLLLDADYQSVESRYWNLSEVAFPSGDNMSAAPKELEEASKIVEAIHKQSRNLIRELWAVCGRFFTINAESPNAQYFDAGHERIILVLLHRLQWNATYLLHLKEGVGLEKEFTSNRSFPSPFDGHKYDFVSDGQVIGAVNVPKHGHPFASDTKDFPPWGLTSPFEDLFPDEVGMAVGDVLARRFMAKTLHSTELPAPVSVQYGLN